MRETALMMPGEHIAWFDDNVEWFLGIEVAELDHPVPSCPGWTVVDAVNHLSFGLGLAYPAALATSATGDADDAWAQVRWPEVYPLGRPALEAFATNMRSCGDRFHSTDAAHACWTYAGPGVAAFWFRRAAIETSMHRIDVAEALGVDPRHLDDQRCHDAIAETMSFALPLGAGLTGAPAGTMVVRGNPLDSAFTIGAGDATATISGDSHDVLCALWGRHRDRVDVVGDTGVADAWLAVIETAFRRASVELARSTPRPASTYDARVPVYVLWSAPRCRSTAFFRSMIERGDMIGVHEPFSDIAGLGESDVDGRPFASQHELLDWLRNETGDVDVFLKDTPDRRHQPVLDDRRFLAEARHAFLIRRPEEIAASSNAIEAPRSVDALGLEFLAILHDAVHAAGGHAPIVIDSDDLVQRPAATMAAYCRGVGLPFIARALNWAPGDRHEWRRSARWHVDVAQSSGFERRAPQYETTVDNSPELARMAAHHRPFYDQLRARRLIVETGPPQHHI